MNAEDNEPIDASEADYDDEESNLNELDEDLIRNIVLESLAEFFEKNPAERKQLIAARNERVNRVVPLPEGLINAAETKNVGLESKGPNDMGMATEATQALRRPLPSPQTPLSSTIQLSGQFVPATPANTPRMGESQMEES